MSLVWKPPLDLPLRFDLLMRSRRTIPLMILKAFVGSPLVPVQSAHVELHLKSVCSALCRLVCWPVRSATLFCSM
jgi:hypothetical protein